MISQHHHSHSPYPPESTTVQPPNLKIRFALPKPIAKDKALAHEALENITKTLGQRGQPYLSLTLTRSRPLRIKLLVPADSTAPGPSSWDRTREVCEGLYMLIQTGHVPPRLAVQLSGRSLDWESIIRGLRCITAGEQSVEAAACVAKAISLIGAELFLIPDPKSDIAKAMGLLINLLAQLPIPMRYWTVARLFSEQLPTVLSTLLKNIEPSDVTRLRELVTAARKSYVASPSHFQPTSHLGDLDAWMNDKAFQTLCEELGVKTVKNPNHSSDSADS